MFMKLKLREGAANDAPPHRSGNGWVACLALNRTMSSPMYAGRVFVLICAAGTGAMSETRKLPAILWRLAAGLVLHGLGEP